MSDSGPASRVQTVLGRISPGELGVILTHEHLLCDLTPIRHPPKDAEGKALYDKPVSQGGILKKCVNSQAVYPLSEQHGLKARERRYTAHEEGKHWE